MFIEHKMLMYTTTKMRGKCHLETMFFVNIIVCEQMYLHKHEHEQEGVDSAYEEHDYFINKYYINFNL
jgi:hypothetical protein